MRPHCPLLVKTIHPHAIMTMKLHYHNLHHELEFAHFISQEIQECQAACLAKQSQIQFQKYSILIAVHVAFMIHGCKVDPQCSVEDYKDFRSKSARILDL